MKKLFFLAACVLFLSACSGERKESGMATGPKWTGTVYMSQDLGAKTETIGEFDTHSECVEKAMMYLQEKGYADGAYSCNA